MTAAAADEDVVAGELLIRTVKLINNSTSSYGLEFEFHKVDLGKKKIEFNEIKTIPPIKGSGTGKLATLDSSIYILGNLYKPEPEPEPEPEEDDIHIYCGASRWSLLLKRWETLKLPFPTYNWPNPATISDNLYCFGSPHLVPKVWNRDHSDWKDLEFPNQLIDRKVSTPVIVDHKNNRALVHFFDTDQIYAFYPHDNEWRCLVEKFNRAWHPAIAVYDNILFIHYLGLVKLIEAYDLSTNESFEIVADFSRVRKTQSLYDVIFTRPQKNNVLCLASQVRCTRTRPASAHFLTFTFNHAAGTNVLKLTALDYQSYLIPAVSNVLDFLLL